MDQNGELEALRAALAYRYRVEREIGQGAFATVYLATDLQYQREVAVKVLKPEWSRAVARDRFLLEIKVVAQLNHPHILPLLDSCERDGFLFYVMPYVAGESLRRRLRREKQLPIDQAIGIARDVADALAAAHAQGVVHRDVKPENILLYEGRAVVTDFGIARAFTEAGGDSLTSAGLGIGTPGYMSPEQATGERNLDQRSDVYGLACVVYEMLVGETPYTGPSSQAIIAKALHQPVPSARLVRETIPRELDQAIQRGLAKVPADRYATVADFAAALEYGAAQPSGAPADQSPWRRPRVMALALASVVMLAAAAWMVLSRTVVGGGSGVPADTSRYAILPFNDEARVEARLQTEPVLRDVLSRWSGISVTDPLRVREAIGSPADARLTQKAAARAVRGLGAGRYLRGMLSLDGDSVRVEAGLYDANADGALLADSAVHLPADLRGRDSLLAILVDGLLLRGLLPPGEAAFTGTRSLPARQAFARGKRALETWDMADADSGFSRAAAFDPSYAGAHLWTALARAWSGAEPPRFVLAAEQAAQGAARLSAQDRAMSEALLAQAHGDLGLACPLWQQRTRAESDDYAAWYGYARCLYRDDAVVADSRSPSGWRFRISYQEMIRAFRRAFGLRPAILSSFRANSYEWARQLLVTSATTMRQGRALAPDTQRFRARLIRSGDSLVLLPYPEWAARSPVAPWDARLVQEAVRRQRALFREIAVTWLTAFPADPAAMEAMAVSLETLGDPAAVDSLRRARTLAQAPADRTREAAAEVWVQVKLGLRGERQRLMLARALADSVLRDASPAGSAGVLAGLAALTGRAGLAASLNRRDAQEAGWAPPLLAGSAPALLVFASLGGPVDSLRRLEQLVAAQLGGDTLSADAAEWLGRPAWLADPVYHLKSADRLVGRGDALLDAVVALAAGDSDATRQAFVRIEAGRRRVQPADRAIEALYAQAKVLVRLGADQEAISWLDPTLNALPWSEPGMFGDVSRPGALVNLIALRADLAARTGDPTGARRWADAVTILWSDADEFLQPVVSRMRRLASGEGPPNANASHRNGGQR